MKRFLKIGLGIILGLMLLGLGLVLLSARFVPANDPLSDSETAFPVLEGTNLLLEKIRIPTELEGDYRLIVVAYNTEQQGVVDKWLLPLEELMASFPQMKGYYVPLLPQDTADAAFPIIGGMTLAAKNDRDRARTLVVFTNVASFNALMGIPDNSQVQLFLLDAVGEVLWQGAGAYQPETLASLKTQLE